MGLQDYIQVSASTRPQLIAAEIVARAGDGNAFCVLASTRPQLIAAEIDATDRIDLHLQPASTRPQLIAAEILRTEFRQLAMNPLQRGRS